MLKTLDKVTMTVIETAPNGVVNSDTIFTFQQTGNTVYGEYAGGKIRKGFLVGQMDGSILTFSYCQLQTDGILDNGLSTCALSVEGSGKIRLVEHFEWKSRPGEFGVNVFQEI
jgi:hypothetical protein